MQCLKVVQVADLGIRQTLGPSVRPAGAQASLPQGTYICLGVLAAADVVAITMDRGHAGMQRFRRGEARSVIHVVRQHGLAKGRGGREISLIGLLAREAAQQGIPHVPMSLHRPGSTIIPRPSSTVAPGAFTALPTATISPFLRCTSPPGISPNEESMVMTYALRRTISPRAGNVPPGPCARRSFFG